MVAVGLQLLPAGFGILGGVHFVAMPDQHLRVAMTKKRIVIHHQDSLDCIRMRHRRQAGNGSSGVCSRWWDFVYSHGKTT